MKIYLASPWFNEEEDFFYKHVIEKMREQGHEVYVPKEHEIPNAWDLKNEDWAREVFLADIEAIRACEEVWVINHGLYSDSGTAWECGFAYGIGKPVRQLLISNHKNQGRFSLMMVNGCEEYDFVTNYLYGEFTCVEIEQKQLTNILEYGIVIM